MDKRFTAVRVLVVSVLAAYLLLGALSTGGVALPIGVLLLGLILWFSVYRFRHNGLGNRELVTKMHADLKGTLERIEERMAQEEAQRRAAEEHEERARVEREKRRQVRGDDREQSKRGRADNTRVRGPIESYFRTRLPLLRSLRLVQRQGKVTLPCA